MKNSKILLAALAAAALCLGACGAVDDEKPTSTAPAAEQQAAAEQGAEEETEPVAENSQAEVDDEKQEEPAESEAEAADSVAEESRAESTVTEEPAALTPTETESGYTFEAPWGEADFKQLNAMGYANTLAGGQKFAIIPSDAAAGSRYFITYFSADGVTWEQNEGFLQLTNGYSEFFALDDSRLMCFRCDGADYHGMPIVGFVTQSAEGGMPEYTPAETTFEGVEFSNGDVLPLDADNEHSYEYVAKYLGGTTIEMIVVDNDSGLEVFDGEFEIQ